jgi:hypothetical protein
MAKSRGLCSKALIPLCNTYFHDGILMKQVQEDFSVTNPITLASVYFMYCILKKKKLPTSQKTLKRSHNYKSV